MHDTPGSHHGFNDTVILSCSIAASSLRRKKQAQSYLLVADASTVDRSVSTIHPSTPHGLICSALHSLSSCGWGGARGQNHKDTIRL